MHGSFTRSRSGMPRSRQIYRKRAGKAYERCIASSTTSFGRRRNAQRTGGTTRCWRYGKPIAVLPRLLRARPVAEATGYVYEGRLRGLDEPAKAGFAAKSWGLQPPGFNNLDRLAICGGDTSGMADAPTDWLVALGYGPTASAAPALPPEPPPAVLARVMNCQAGRYGGA